MRQFSALQLKTASAIWRRAVKSAKRLVGPIARSTPLIVGSASLSWVKASFDFSAQVVKIIRAQGHRGLAIYLKACNVMLMQSVAGHKVGAPHALGAAVARTKSGLPRIIPAGFRQRIKQGDIGAIRLYLGFFSLYRVLDYRGKLSISTIISPGKELTPEFLREWQDHSFDFVRLLGDFGVKPFRVDLVPERHPRFLEDWINTVRHPSPLKIKNFKSERRYRAELWGYVVKFIPLLRSGPNSGDGRLNVACLIDDWIAWVSRPEFFKLLVSYVALVRAWPLLNEDIFRQVDQLLDRNPAWKDSFGDLGALAFVEEPGKMRVVAMVDSLTQWLLYPLHRYIYDRVLRLIPQDGLYDQLAPVESLLERKRLSRDHRIFSFDLSAATDRIPVVIQEVLLSAFTHAELSSLWRRLLVEREYRLPPLWVKTFGVKAGTHVQYRVGQPMGAYSSWAMLALVHHAMVQWSAKKAGLEGWFTEYAVLGDDLVIGDYRVASEYASLCDTLGVQIGLHKSIISNNLSAEFAKRFFYRGTQASPVPLIGIAVGWLGVRAIPELLRMVRDRTQSGLSLYHTLKFMGQGFRQASAASNKKLSLQHRRARSTVLLLTRPGAVHGVSTLLEWYSQVRFGVSKDPAPGVGRALMDAFQARVIQFKSLNLRRRLFKAFIGFDLSQLWTKETLFGIHSWWDANIVSPIKEPILRRLDEVDNEITRILADEESTEVERLSALVSEFEDLEEEVAMIPREMVVMRSVKETLRLERDRFPRRVKMWSRISKIFEKGHRSGPGSNPGKGGVPTLR